MKTRALLQVILLMIATGLFAAEDTGEENQAGAHRSPSADGASVSFSNLSDGDVVPPVFIVKFSISGMGVAPAGVEIENTGHHHLLIDVAVMPNLNQPLPATDNIRHFGKGQGQTELQLAEGEHSLQLRHHQRTGTAVPAVQRGREAVGTVRPWPDIRWYGADLSGVEL